MLRIFYNAMLATLVGTAGVVIAVLAGHLSGWFVQMFFPDAYFRQYPIAFAALVVINLAVGRLILWDKSL